MKALSKLFVLIAAIPFLSGCEITSSSFFSNSMSVSDNNCVSEKDISDIEVLEKRLPVPYYDVIDPFSSTQFDYKNPFNAIAQIRRIDSDKFLFEGEDCYKILSLFDNILLKYVIKYSETFDNQQFFDDLRDGIKINVKYSDLLDKENIVSTRFQISKEGRIGFLTSEQAVLFYTDPGEVSFENVESKIKEIDNDYQQKNAPNSKRKEKSFSLRQNRTSYILTPNKSGVIVYYDVEMELGEIEDWNQAGDTLVPEANRIADSSAVYNCNSYAWYSRTTSNCVWIRDENIHPYIDDGTYEEINGIGDVGDIIFYFNSNNENIHSGVVIAKTEGISNNICGNSNLVTVRSKWGEWGLYEHRGDQCPYTSTYGGSAVYVKYYRVHFNESVSLSNPSQNTTQIIEEENNVAIFTQPPDFIQTNHYAMFELNINYAKYYSFEITADYYLEVNLFKGPMVEMSINNATVIENGVYKVAFNYYATPDVYYLRVTYENSSSSGTINTKIINEHSHNYSTYVWYSYTKHYRMCTCNSSFLTGHVVSQNAYNQGGQYATCLLCNGLASIGFIGPMNQNNLAISPNGSFILPNGVIVLVDEDLDAYLNDSLVFNLPNSN